MSNDQASNYRELSYEILSDDRLYEILSAHQNNIALGMLQGFDDFRISVAGAQEKTALLQIGNKWSIPKGATPTSHIIKLPIGVIKQPDNMLDLSESVENELFCLLLAKALNFAVPNAEIIHCNGVKALAVERFDRRWIDNKKALLRLPQEDMCQVFGKSSAIKYEADGGVGIAEIMKLLEGSNHAIADREAFMRFQTFQCLIGATDGHAKNFSIFIEVSGGYRLTPFYDIISAYPLLGARGINIRSLKLAMGLKATKGKKYHLDKIFRRHLIATAEAVSFSAVRMDELIDELVNQLPQAIESTMNGLPSNFPMKIAQSISEHSLQRAKRLALMRTIKLC